MTTGPKSPDLSACGQCGRQAVCVINGATLCVSCYYELEVARTLGFRLSAINMNLAAAEMDMVTGLRNFTPKIQVPDLPRGPLHLHNIRIDNSVIGVVNTGEVQTIDVHITHLKQGGQVEIGDVLKRVTEAIANSQDLSSSQKAEMLESLGYLSEQAAGAAKDRRPSIIKATLGALTQGAAAVATLSEAWSTAAPILSKYFGLG